MEMQPISGEEASTNRDKLNEVEQSRRGWMDKLKRRLQLYAQFRKDKENIDQRLKELRDKAGKLEPTPENLEPLEVPTFLGFIDRNNLLFVKVFSRL